MNDIIEEFCKRQLLNSTLFLDNSAKILDPNFDTKGFLCEVLKLTDVPNINPVFQTGTVGNLPTQTDYSGMDAGDVRAPLGSVLNAAFAYFMPRNIIYTESLKYGGTQVINDVICDKDGNPARVSTTTTLDDPDPQMREVKVMDILKSEEVITAYPTYDFTQTICLEQQDIVIANLDRSVDEIDSEPLIEIEPNSSDHKDIFIYDSSVDVCYKPLDFEKLFIPSTVEEYKQFTKDFVTYGTTQYLLYFAAFIKRFFTERPNFKQNGGEVLVGKDGYTSYVQIKIRKEPIKQDFKMSFTKSAPVVDASGNEISPGVMTYHYKSNVVYYYIKYFEDKTEDLATLLGLDSVSVSVTAETNFKGTGQARALMETIPDYKRIMKNADLQIKLFKYIKKYHAYIPAYNDSNIPIDNPEVKRYSYLSL
jgi:hypothetical protein